MNAVCLACFGRIDQMYSLQAWGGGGRRKASAELHNNFTLNLKRGQGSNDGQRKKLEGNLCFGANT